MVLEKSAHRATRWKKPKKSQPVLTYYFIICVMSEKLFEETVIQEIRDLLMSRQQSIAVGESVSSGLLQLAFSGMPDAIQFYQGGVTAYNLTQKIKFFPWNHFMRQPSIVCHKGWRTKFHSLFAGSLLQIGELE